VSIHGYILSSKDISRFFTGKFITKNNRFTVVPAQRSVSAVIYTCRKKRSMAPIMSNFFLQAIFRLCRHQRHWLKIQRNELPANGNKNVFYDYEERPVKALQLMYILIFSSRTIMKNIVFIINCCTCLFGQSRHRGRFSRSDYRVNEEEALGIDALKSQVSWQIIPVRI